MASETKMQPQRHDLALVHLRHLHSRRKGLPNVRAHHVRAADTTEVFPIISS